MAITVPQNTGWSRATASPATLGSLTISAGNHAVTCLHTFGGAAAGSVSDGTAYGQGASKFDGGTNRWTAIYFRYLAAGGTVASVITQGGASELCGITYEVAGLDTSSALDLSVASAATNIYRPTSGSVTAAGATAQANEIVFAVLGGRSNVAGVSITAPTDGGGGASYTQATPRLGDGTLTNSPCSAAYLILSATETPSAVWVSSPTTNFADSTAFAAMATFIAAASTGRVVKMAGEWGGFAGVSGGFAG